MLSTRTKIWGTPRFRRALRTSAQCVTRVKRTTIDTEAATRKVNKSAPSTPCSVMEMLVYEKPQNCCTVLKVAKVTRGTPGEKMLRVAGNAITPAKIGMNIHTRLIKKPIGTFDIKPRNSTSTYTAKIG